MIEVTPAPPGPVGWYPTSTLQLELDLRCTLIPLLITEACPNGNVLTRSYKLATLLNFIEGLFVEEDIYHPTLVPAHIAVADIYAEIGAYETTLFHLTKALEVARANGGPYGGTQLPVLERVRLKVLAIESYVEIAGGFSSTDFFPPNIRIGNSRRRLKQDVDALIVLLDETRAFGAVIGALTVEERIAADAMLSEFENRLSRFKSDWPQIFN